MVRSKYNYVVIFIFRYYLFLVFFDGVCCWLPFFVINAIKNLIIFATYIKPGYHQ